MRRPRTLPFAGDVRRVGILATALSLLMITVPVPASANDLDPIPFRQHQEIPATDYSFAAWGDYDGDGDLDLAAGCTGTSVRIFKNDPTGVLTEVQSMPCGRSTVGNSNPWADYDGDGDLDLALPGRGASYMYTNDSGVFVPDTRTSLPAQGSGGVWYQWGDLDLDNDPDLVLIGVNHSGVFINDGTGQLTANPSHGIPTRDNHDGDLGDYDNDGDLDLVTVGTGASTAGAPFALRIYSNDGSANFTPLGGELADRMGNVNWVDYNQDGMLDIFAAGSHQNAAWYVELWRQDSSGGFTQTVPDAFADFRNLHPGGFHEGWTAWGDYDSDGDPDLFMSNTTDLGCLTRTYRNEPTGYLVEDDTTLLHNTGQCYFRPSWGDFDDDLDLELVTVDFFAASTFVRVWKRNQPPAVTSLTVPTAPVQVGEAILATGQFVDPNVLDTHTAVFDWGDGSPPTPGTVVESGGSGTVSGTYTYANPGVHTVCLTVTDDVGAAGSRCSDFVVVYDPDGGFVTGGGWIDSPAGAYVPDSALVGKANFGFVSKYKKGANIPTGNTEFMFSTADLNFHSVSYDWLVVTGNDYAMFKGNGTINGEGAYEFKLWAGDDDPDTFRIKIWEETDGSESVVYDNGMDQAIGGGNIIVHKK